MPKTKCILCGQDCVNESGAESFYIAGSFAICDGCYKGKKKTIELPREKIKHENVIQRI